MTRVERSVRAARLLLCALGLAAACGGGGGEPPPPEPQAPPVGISVEVSPDLATLAAGEALQLVATVAGTSDPRVVWSIVEGGADVVVDDAGLVTAAPRAAGTYHLAATSAADARAVAYAEIRVVSVVSVEVWPDAAVVRAGRTITLSAAVAGAADPAVAWSVTGGGSITPEGVYTAPATPGTYAAVATSRADPSRSASCTITVRPALALEVAPAAPALYAGDTIWLTATVDGVPTSSVRWSILEWQLGGAITGYGAYRAPLAPGEYHVVATYEPDPSVSATATVTVTPAVAVTPAALVAYTGAVVDFQASGPGVGPGSQPTWFLDGALMGPRPWRAPDAPGGHAVVARLPSGATAAAVLTVLARPAVAISGIVTGAEGAISLALDRNPATVQVLPGDGAFTFPGGAPLGRAYRIDVGEHGGGRTCTVVNGAGIATPGVPGCSVRCGGFPRRIPAPGESVQLLDAALRPGGGAIYAGTWQTAGGDVGVLSATDGEGAHDASFGIGGLVQLVPAALGTFSGVEVQQDGRPLAAGCVLNPSGRRVMLLARFEVGGRLDVSFGTGGITTLDWFGLGESCLDDVAVQRDGTIVAAGWASDGIQARVAVARWTAAGVLDASFGVGGKRTISAGSTLPYGVKLAIDGAGGTFVAHPGPGYSPAIERLRGDGSIDAAFTVSLEGVVGNAPAPFSIVTGDDGGLLVYGASPGWPGGERLIRLAPNGAVDPAAADFSIWRILLGDATSPLAPDFTCEPRALWRDGADVLVAAVCSEPSAASRLYLSRLGPDLIPDPSWGVGGLASVAVRGLETVVPAREYVLAGVATSGVLELAARYADAAVGPVELLHVLIR